MAEKRGKTLSYRRAEWLADIPAGTTLESCLKAAHSALKTVEERTIIRDSGQCLRSAKKLSPHSGGIFLHIVADTPGEETSVVPKAKKDTEEVEIGTAAAPEDAEFMDGDAFLFVKDNHVFLCSTGLRDGAVRLFLYEFFTKAKLGKHATRFDLLKTPNLDKMKLLIADGVKEIQLRASLYQATMQYEKRKSTTAGVLRTIGTHLRKVIESENEDRDDSLRVAIVIKTDERVRKHLTLGEKRIEEMAKDIVKNCRKDDEFIIETGSGQKISAEEIFLNETVLIDGYGKSVKCQKAWESLDAFYRRLKKSGALEQ